MARGAGHPTAIAGDQNARAHLVALAFEPTEEALDADQIPVTGPDDRALGVGELLPRHGQSQPALGGDGVIGMFVFGVARGRPGGDGVFEQRLRWIGHDAIPIDGGDPAEAFARGAGARRAIGREQPRLARRRFVVAVVAGERGGDAHAGRIDVHVGASLAEGERVRDGLREA